MRLPSFATWPRLPRRLHWFSFCIAALVAVVSGCADLRDFVGRSPGAMVASDTRTPSLPVVRTGTTAGTTQATASGLPAATLIVPKNQSTPGNNVKLVAAQLGQPVAPTLERLPDNLKPKLVESDWWADTNPQRQQGPTEQEPVGSPRSPLRLGFSSPDTGKQVPINLDTVLRLAETQNSQSASAREKLEEAFATQELAGKAWLPEFWVGASWYRHDGGIANPDGTLEVASFNSMFAGLEICGRMDLREAIFTKVDAERRTWQQRGEVSKLTAEALLEASTAYVDLLSARAAEGIGLQMERHLQELLKETSALAKTLPAAEVEVVRIQADLSGHQQLIRKFREGALAATAKLIYHLGLDPATEIVVMDRHLAAFTIVNADVPADSLIALAVQNGPGIHDLEGLLHAIQEASAKSGGLMDMMPVFDMRVAEGGFGTGPGSRMDWDNRFDLGIQMRWNLTEFVTRREKQRVAQARIGQAHASYHELQAKLTMGVQESREAALSGRDQMDIAAKQVQHATDAYNRSKTRMNQANVKDRSPSEVLLSIRALTAANLSYLATIREHDKAQLRLAILTGTIGNRCGA